MRFAFIIVASIASFGALCAQSTSAPSGNSPGIENAPVATETVDVKLKFFRWSHTNTVVMGGLGDAPESKTTKQAQREARNSSASKRRQKDEDSLVLWYKTGSLGAEEWSSLMMMSGSDSKILNYKGPPEITFYEKLPPRNETEEAYYRRKASLNIPSGAQDLYVLMFVNNKTINFFPMNISPDKIGKDQVAIVNMATQPVGVTLGEKKRHLLNPGRFHILKMRKNDDRLEVKLYTKEDDEWIVLYGNNLIHTPDKRSILLIYDPFGQKQLNLSVQMLTF